MRGKEEHSWALAKQGHLCMHDSRCLLWKHVHAFLAGYLARERTVMLDVRCWNERILNHRLPLFLELLGKGLVKC